MAKPGDYWATRSQQNTSVREFNPIFQNQNRDLWFGSCQNTVITRGSYEYFPYFPIALHGLGDHPAAKLDMAFVEIAHGKSMQITSFHLTSNIFQSQLTLLFFTTCNAMLAGKSPASAKAMDLTTQASGRSVYHYLFTEERHKENHLQHQFLVGAGRPTHFLHHLPDFFSSKKKIPSRVHRSKNLRHFSC